ncbi:ABC transporter permease [Candidatus Zixiibacteriota bacterium]
MIRFLLKGIVRDRHRSFFPVIIVMLGVMISVLMYCFMHGVMDETIRSNARLDTGHVKITTRGYQEISRQLPNDLAIVETDQVLLGLERDYPEMDWAARVKFGGLLDLPDEYGETRAQGPTFGFAADLLSASSGENERLNLAKGLIQGRLPESAGEILVSEDFARRLGAEIGDAATLISSTANGGMAIQNFTLAGTVRFGIGPLDRNMMIADLEDIQYALDMEGSAAEILGFFPNSIYNEKVAGQIAADFNSNNDDPEDEFALTMLTLREQGGLGEYLDMTSQRVSIILASFFLVMSIVLWNAGLMSGIRRYGEIGVRLAIGESKGRVYRFLLGESLLVGFAGSMAGTAVGLGLSYYLQEVGLDISGMMKGSTILMANVMRAKITPASYYIGFIPGLLATFLGSAISGINIFRRQTAQLFKELEA